MRPNKGSCGTPDKSIWKKLSAFAPCFQRFNYEYAKFTAPQVIHMYGACYK